MTGVQTCALPISLKNGRAKLPNDVNLEDPYQIFKLIYTDELLEELAVHTNEYAKLHPTKKKNARCPRPWKPTTAGELLAYLAVTIYMGLHIETDIKDYWNKNPAKGPLHKIITAHISLVQFQQLDRMFHISKPKPIHNPTKESPFDKIHTLSEYIRQRCRQYWELGTHLSVDEMIERFTGRVHEIINIPSKPTPEGFKIWVLANQGYILDWLFHAKGNKNGPVNLDTHFTDEEGFSKMQAVVLDLLF